jgi:hypothetical protein
MPESLASTLLTRWENFYVIVGSAAAALTGLQFVVIALVAQTRLRTANGGVDAFSTPTIVYFTTVMLLAAILCAPWGGLAIVAALIAVWGAAGVGYAGLVARRATRQTQYRLVLEDWIWHIVLPLAAHAMLLTAGLTLPRQPAGALFIVATAALLLLIIGIHNAWDTVTFVVLNHMQPKPHDGNRQEPPPPA